jgi:hypothetical protein
LPHCWCIVLFTFEQVYIGGKPSGTTPVPVQTQLAWLEKSEFTFFSS